MRYDRPFWRDDGLAGFATSVDHPASIVFDNCPPDAACGLLLAFFEGAHAREASRLSSTARRGVAVDGLIDLFGEGAADPRHYVDLDWSSEAWTGGCYGRHLGRAVWTQLGPDLHQAFDRVSFAGAETAAEWDGYMDGAIASGVRAAQERIAHAGR